MASSAQAGAWGASAWPDGVGKRVDILAGRFPLIEAFRHLVRNFGTAGIDPSPPSSNGTRFPLRALVLVAGEPLSAGSVAAFLHLSHWHDLFLLSGARQRFRRAEGE